MQRLNLNFVATIPVGHRVKVTFYQRKASRLSAVFSGEPKGVMIQDLETGVEYSTGFIWQCSHQDGMFVYASELEPAVVVTGSLDGTVARCRVISHRGNAGNHQITTHLEVQENTAG